MAPELLFPIDTNLPVLQRTVPIVIITILTILLSGVLTICQALCQRQREQHKHSYHPRFKIKTLKFREVKWLSQGHTARKWESQNWAVFWDRDLFTAPTQILRALVWAQGNEATLTGQVWGSNEKITSYRAWHMVGIPFLHSFMNLLNQISTGLRSGQKNGSF